MMAIDISEAVAWAKGALAKGATRTQIEERLRQSKYPEQEIQRVLAAAMPEWTAAPKQAPAPLPEPSEPPFEPRPSAHGPSSKLIIGILLAIVAVIVVVITAVIVLSGSGTGGAGGGTGGGGTGGGIGGVGTLSMQDCGISTACFNQAYADGDSCTPAKVSAQTTSSQGDTMAYYAEIRGRVGGGCSVYIYITEVASTNPMFSSFGGKSAECLLTHFTADLIESGAPAFVRPGYCTGSLITTMQQQSY